MKIKRIASVLLAALMMFSVMSAITVFADDNESYDKFYRLKNTAEEKIICNAKIENNFVDNNVVLSMTREESYRFADYTIEDFEKLGVSGVAEIKTAYSFDAKQKIAQFSTTVVNELELEPDYEQIIADAIVKNELDKLPFADALVTLINQKTELGDMLESIFGYHKVMTLVLNAHDKQNVLDTIKILEKSDIILYAEPNYLRSLIDVVTDTTPADTDTATDTKPATADTASNTNKQNNANGAIPTGEFDYTILLALIAALSVVFGIAAIKQGKKHNT